MKPVDIPTRETTRFLRSHAPAGATVLEVGCGDGRVAARLRRDGFRVVALDTRLSTLTEARSCGVPAVWARWPAFASTAVDVVAFTRSLHHISPLPAAVERARELLTPGGSLLIEDFAFDEADGRTIRWLRNKVRTAADGGLLAPARRGFASELLAAADPEGFWSHDHDHDQHTAPAMLKAVAERLTVRGVLEVPYLYRYLAAELAPSPTAATFLEEVFEEESELSARGEILAIGRRIVAVC